MPRVDMNLQLLRCLEVLVAECHVSRAADRLGMSQSGMSTALARLREIFGDPILVRTSHGMILSERAPEIAGAARRALAEIDFAIHGDVDFDISSVKTEFRIMASDYVGHMLLPLVLDTSLRQAPDITLTVVQPQPNRIREALANSEVDLVVGFFHDVSEGLFQTSVLSEPLVCLRRVDHPRISDTLSLRQYGNEAHTYFGSPPTFISSIEIVIERTLRPIGISRRIRANLPSMAMIPKVVEQTDLLATVPRGLADSYAGRYGVVAMQLPFDPGSLMVRAIWHDRMHANKAHKWLRQLFQSSGKSLQRTLDED